MILVAVNVRQTSMAMHSEVAPDSWYGILSTDFFLADDCHNRMRLHSDILRLAKKLRSDPSHPAMKVMLT